MRKKLLVIFFLVSILALVPVGMAQAKKPLIGSMNLEFNLDWFTPGVDPTKVPDWVGSVTIGGNPYGMLFFAIESGKPFDTDPNTKVHFFKEIWAIYLEVDLPSIPSSDPGDWADWQPVKNPNVPILWGYDVGITTQNSKYHMNGNVEVANGIFSDWVGRNVYMSGDIEWYPNGLPHFAPGTFRIN
jgi:hypothetical protein